MDADETQTSPTTHLLWFVDGLLLFFLVSWGLTTRLWVDNDFYYAVFIWVALTFLYRYVRVTNTDVGGAFATRWRSSLLVGALAATYVAIDVWRANPTEHPGGLELLFEIVWRGVAYGVVNSFVLTAFPLAVAFGVLGGNLQGVVRRIGFAVVAAGLVWTMSLVYHLGFEQYDRDVVTPQLAPAAASVPAVLTANPIGSIAAQTTLHVVATYRTFESPVFVPPEVEFVPHYEPPGVFGPR